MIGSKVDKDMGDASLLLISIGQAGMQELLQYLPNGLEKCK